MSVQLSFRFLKLDKLQAITMSREIEGAEYSETGEAKVFIGYVPLIESNFDEINHFFIRQKIVIEDCDVLIRQITLGNKAEWSIPVTVNRFLKGIDCKLTVYCGD